MAKKGTIEKNDEESKRNARIGDLAAEEVRYLRQAGWLPVLVGPKNEVMYKDPRKQQPTCTMSVALNVQKKRDKYWEIFP